MKKQLLTLALIAATGVPCFGQGYFLFQAVKNKAFDLSTGVSAPGGTNDTFAFLWANSASASSAVGAGTSSSVAGIPTGTWAQIMADPLFHFATDANNAGAIAMITGNGASGFNYNNGFSFPVTSSPNSGTVSLYLVGWNNKNGTLNTPAQAAAANTSLGYSSVFTYDPGATSGTAVLSFAAVSAFGIQAIPEPATFALAGFGAAAMLIFRRRK